MNYILYNIKHLPSQHIARTRYFSYTRLVDTVTTAVKTPGGLAWELMYEVFKASKPYMEVIAAGFDLTPQQIFAIKSLDEDRQITMSAFATTLGCDASNVTSIVDKLETRGIVERRASSLDRRVKVLVMTPAGIELKNRIAEAMQNPPPAIANLSTEDQEAICTLFRRALDTL